jgi:GT2 family glycosyltransferase
MAEPVYAVVVTHNRKELLRECLTAVQAQTRPVDHLLVVDNASTDGTAELVAAEFPQAEVMRLATNEGAAGGFHEGMKRGLESGHEWLWVMDDDTIPSDDALALLLEASERTEGPPPALLASRINWTNGRLHPMNVPMPHLGDLDRLAGNVERGMLALRASTFPSLLVRAAAVRRHGLPRKSFFIWSDDIDFTMRILRDEPGFLVPASVATHKTKTAHAPWEGGPRYYYAIRNGIWILRSDSMEPKEKVVHVALIGEQTRRFLAANRFTPSSIMIVLRGLRDGLLRRPS